MKLFRLAKQLFFVESLVCSVIVFCSLTAKVRNENASRRAQIFRRESRSIFPNKFVIENLLLKIGANRADFYPIAEGECLVGSLSRHDISLLIED